MAPFPEPSTPAPPPFAVVGFDLDGTLVDTGDDLAAAANHALAVAGRAPVSRAAVLRRVGAGTHRMLSALLADTGGTDDSLEARVLPSLLDHYAANLADHSRPYDGVADSLAALAAAGVRLGVVTNKPERLTLALLDAVGLRDRFACVIGGDTPGAGRNKPAGDPVLAMIDRCGGGRAAFVGDSSYDVLAARAARVPVIAVSFGFATVPASELGADLVIDHYRELVPALARLAALPAR